ncbi:hypothetical protein [Flectobacillus roseus]|uniref:Heavy metal-binding domain-containing protein n=1 Tax=Flectobacillus roseus TaxID=502259 RepID=A0ABT6Y751_9BACT|nr:hypothetical protein [Flectobacillus roseus]MDI9859394.1 hypothetical protein [Flectobacillus roseus]
MMQKVFNNSILKGLASILFIGLVLSCNKPPSTSSYYRPNYERGGYDSGVGLNFGIDEKYPIEILQGTDKPANAFEEIENLKIEGEYPLTTDQEYKGRMLKRGNDEQQKRDLLKQMVEKAQDLGASGLMNVNYKVFSTATTSGYILTGKAFRYVIKPQPKPAKNY